MEQRRVLYTVEEAARLLGISASTVYRWAREGELRTIPVRGRMVVPASSLEQLLGLPDGVDVDIDLTSDESLNEVAIAGRVVAQPELKESRRGVRYATMRLVIRDGTRREPFQVVVVAFDGCAELLSGLRCGELIRVDGHLAQREWTAEGGVRIGAQRVVAKHVRSLEPASEVAS